MDKQHSEENDSAVNDEILMELGAVSKETKGIIGGMWETDVSLDLKGYPAKS